MKRPIPQPNSETAKITGRAIRLLERLAQRAGYKAIIRFQRIKKN